MADGASTFEPISTYAGRHCIPTAWCLDERDCGHHTVVDLDAAITLTGNMPRDRFTARLRFAKCGGRAKLVISWR